MAVCKECGKKFGFLETGVGGLCFHCDYISSVTPDEVEAFTQTAKRQEDIEALMLTTETAPNLNITKRIEIVTAECAFGMNIFKDLFAGVRETVYRVRIRPTPLRSDVQNSWSADQYLEE